MKKIFILLVFCLVSTSCVKLTVSFINTDNEKVIKVKLIFKNKTHEEFYLDPKKEWLKVYDVKQMGAVEKIEVFIDNKIAFNIERGQLPKDKKWVNDLLKKIDFVTSTEAFEYIEKRIEETANINQINKS